MKNRILLITLSLVLASMQASAEPKRRIDDRERLCSLMFGKYENNAFVSSTPMQDACNSGHYESRKRICEYNYKKREIISACISTYDAITQNILNAKKYNSTLHESK